MELVVADIGGTNARFALAELAEGKVAGIGREVTLATSSFPSLAMAWKAYQEELGQPLPPRASIAIAAPVGENGIIKMTNNSWLIRPAGLNSELGLDQSLVLNDFGAVAHAVSVCPANWLEHMCGPDEPLPENGAISVVGPGTGLGVALIVRRHGRNIICETEGSHIDFAPRDAFEDRLLGRMRREHGRVSVERLACGSALPIIYSLLSEGVSHSAQFSDQKSLWQAAINGDDELAVAALERFSLILGGAAGDMALAHGSKAVVLAGGLGYRLKDYLPGSGFPFRFADKGRYKTFMRGLPVKLITLPEPGLTGAAAAFAEEYHA